MNNISYQKEAEILGKNGCYFLSICKLAEQITKQDIDVIRIFNYCKSQKGYDGNPWINNEAYCYYPNLILSFLIGAPTTVSKNFNLEYKPEKDEYLIGCYQRKEVGVTYAHFVVLDSKKKVVYDPYGDSLTVKNGQLQSLRVFKIR